MPESAVADRTWRQTGLLGDVALIGNEPMDARQDGAGRAAGRTGPRPRRVIALVLASLLLLPATGHAQTDAGDPLESFNRGVFQVNLFLDELILEPVALGYRLVTPGIVRTGVRNFLDNLSAPLVAANDLLQGEPQRATDTIGRFMLNTIMGVGGLVDVGGMLGMPERHFEDFGQTLAVYGVGSGPYLLLPLLGPSNPRDAAGRVVGFFTDPFGLFTPTDISIARAGADVLSFREANIENIEELRRTSLDFYAATRTLAQQYRANEIRNGAPAPLDDIYDEDIYDEGLYDDDGDLEDPAAAPGIFEDPALEDPADDGGG
jgi:phospholipid-binding lipoprotein MlaA